MVNLIIYLVNEPVVIDTSCPIETINGLLDIYDSINDELLWLYPFAWAVIVVRKVFFV